jgi:hypothetical protein
MILFTELMKTGHLLFCREVWCTFCLLLSCNEILKVWKQKHLIVNIKQLWNFMWIQALTYWSNVTRMRKSHKELELPFYVQLLI